MPERPGLLQRVTRIALRRGLLEGSRPWMYTGVAALTLRLVRRATRQAPNTVVSEEVKPGDTIQIRVVPPSE